MDQEIKVGPIKVTVSDPETGQVLEERTFENDYFIVCSGKRYIKNIQVMGRTHMLAVAWDSTPPSLTKTEDD